MANTLFTASSRFAVIELTLVRLFKPGESERFWKSYIPFYVNNYPHKASQKRLQAFAEEVSVSKITDYGASMKPFKYADVLVDVSVLRDDLESAIEFVCTQRSISMR